MPTGQLRRAAQPHLQRLVDRVQESANLLVLSGSEVRFVTTIECSQVLRVGDRSGKALPAHLSSAGKAMLAHVPEEQLSAVLTDLHEVDPRPRVAASRLCDATGSRSTTSALRRV